MMHRVQRIPRSLKQINHGRNVIKRPSRKNGTLACLVSFMIIQYHFFFNYTAVEQSKKIQTRIKQEHHFDSLSCELNTRMPKHWCMDSSVTPRHIGNTTLSILPIQRYNHQGFEKCLANKTIVLIGDSRVRYQFMHLAAFLNRKSFMKCQDYRIFADLGSNSSIVDDDCYLIDIERNAKMKTHDWKQFFVESTKMTESNHTEQRFRQYSLCDCFRPGPYKPTDIYENRFIKRETDYGEVNLIYLQNLLNFVRMNQDYPPFSSFWSEQRCQPGECSDSNRTNAFTGTTNDTLWILPHLNATHAFVSQGWGNLRHTIDISCLIKNFEDHHPDVATYIISHPHHKADISDPSVFFDESKLECKVKSLDRATMSKDVPREWYWDDFHVLSILNEEFNHKLIDSICPIAGFNGTKQDIK